MISVYLLLDCLLNRTVKFLPLFVNSTLAEFALIFAKAASCGIVLSLPREILISD